MLQNILPIMVQMRLPIPPQILDYLDLPIDLVAAWKQVIQAMMPPAGPEAGMPGQPQSAGIIPGQPGAQPGDFAEQMVPPGMPGFRPVRMMNPK